MLIALSFDARGAQTWTPPDLSSYAELPIEVRVGLQVDQITQVDQRAENFGIVATLRMEWLDSNLAFTPPQDRLPFQGFSGAAFIARADAENLFYPGFTMVNQQGRRFASESNIIVFPDGRAVYFERFTVTLQAPDFDFRGYPFDSQRFFVAFQTQWSNRIMRFVADEPFTGLGDHLGEEEWMFRAVGIEYPSLTNIMGQPSTGITFVFEADRHIWYYILRIFVPLLIIITVSWVTFFLQDFSKRVDISAGNLLVFVAFNFAISGDLPRLGYMTFLDAILAMSFVVTSLAVVWNVLLRRFEVAGMERGARLVDAYTFWLYPGAYAVVTYLAFRYFFPDWSVGFLLRHLTSQ